MVFHFQCSNNGVDIYENVFTHDEWIKSGITPPVTSTTTTSSHEISSPATPSPATSSPEPTTATTTTEPENTTGHSSTTTNNSPEPNITETTPDNGEIGSRPCEKIMLTVSILLITLLVVSNVGCAAYQLFKR